MFKALQNWVENAAAQAMKVQSNDSSVSLPLCVYPLKITYRGNGPAKSAARLLQLTSRESVESDAST
jgi:hypothetical protein